MRILVVLALLVVLGPREAPACGVETDCEIGSRTYRIALPEGQAPRGALIYAHGYRGSAEAAMRNEAMISFAHAEGMAFVATKSADIDWLIPGVPIDPSASGEQELAYYDAVVEDLATRHGIDRDRLVATGFSAGGMMVWNLACYRAETFAAFVPIAGTFWDPIPSDCPAGAVNLVHIHGTSDKVVPLTGRPIGTTSQGDVFGALDMMGEDRGYGERLPVPGGDDLTCAARSSVGGEMLAFCTHPGGHSLKTAYLEVAFDLLRRSGALSSPE